MVGEEVVLGVRPAVGALDGTDDPDGLFDGNNDPDGLPLGVIEGNDDH